MSLKATGLALLVMIIWGTNFSVIKIGATEIPPLAFLAIRFLAAGLLFLPFSKWPGWVVTRDLFIIGILMGALHQGTMYIGSTMIEAGTMSILLQTQVIFVTLIGYFFLKESVGWRTWSGIALGFIGVTILIGGVDLNANAMGYILGITSALFVAFAYIRMKKLQDVHPCTYISVMYLTTLPIIALMSFAMERELWAPAFEKVDWNVLILTLLYQVIIVSFSQILWQRLLAKNPVSQVVPWTLLMPIFALISAYILLNETLTIQMIIGASLTISGVGIITIRKIQKSEPIENAGA